MTQMRRFSADNFQVFIYVYTYLLAALYFEIGRKSAILYFFKKTPVLMKFFRLKLEWSQKRFNIYKLHYFESNFRAWVLTI